MDEMTFWYLIDQSLELSEAEEEDDLGADLDMGDEQEEGEEGEDGGAGSGGSGRVDDVFGGRGGGARGERDFEGSYDSASHMDRQLSALKGLLARLSEDELVGFQEIVDYLMDQAYTWGLWGAAYLMLGGCSDDDFEYFRAGLIMCGKEVYEEAVKDPDSLADGDEVQICEDILTLACEVYEERSGDGAIYDRHREVMNLEPAGEPFEESDDDHFKEHYPRLWARYSQE